MRPGHRRTGANGTADNQRQRGTRTKEPRRTKSARRRRSEAGGEPEHHGTPTSNDDQARRAHGPPTAGSTQGRHAEQRRAGAAGATTSQTHGATRASREPHKEPQRVCQHPRRAKEQELPRVRRALSRAPAATLGILTLVTLFASTRAGRLALASGLAASRPACALLAAATLAWARRGTTSRRRGRPNGINKGADAGQLFL
jgi:hypothetical protein